MKCIGCKKKPDEIREYVVGARVEGITPEEFVKELEGTYNKFQKGNFYCTSCYIKAGQPLIK